VADKEQPVGALFVADKDLLPFPLRRSFSLWPTTSYSCKENTPISIAVNLCGFLPLILGSNSSLHKVRQELQQVDQGLDQQEESSALSIGRLASVSLLNPSGIIHKKKRKAFSLAAPATSASCCAGSSCETLVVRVGLALLLLPPISPFIAIAERIQD
jgi:hypothetical protein